MPDWKEQAKEYAAAIVAAVKEEAGEFLEEHKDAAKLLEERAFRMAELGVDLGLAKTEDEKAAIKSEMEAVTLTLEQAAVNIALDADEEAREFFKSLAKIALGFAKNAIPYLVKLVPLA